MKRRSDSEKKQRRGLYAKIGLARKALGINEDIYREMLAVEFGADSATELTIGQLERLVRIFQGLGWKSDPDRRVEALRARAREIAGRLPDGERRLAGLVRRICLVERLAWCRDADKLKRLLAALGKIENEYAAPPASGGRAVK